MRKFSKIKLSVIFSAILLCASLGAVPSASAKIERGKSMLLMDAATGKVLYQEKAYAKRYPASLTKMMTLYMLFYAVENTRLGLDSRLITSKNAASKPATNLKLKKGERIKVRDAISALIVQSANDVATVVAESLGKTERNFGKIMTKKAKQLGMRNTNFNNASGLPDSKQISTAYDVALLTRSIMRDFPKYYKFFQQQTFKYKGKTYHNHNKLLGKVKGVEGMKTGYIRAAGFHLATSYKSPKNGRRLIAVYMGADKPEERRVALKSLFNHYEKRRLYAFKANRKNGRFAMKK